MKKTAFTLAEVLISLAIIGVITALTLPSVINNTKAKSNSALLKSTYKQVEDAMQQVLIDQGVRSIFDLEFTGNNDQEKLSNFMRSYLDVVNDCEGSANRCFSGTYTSYSGSSVSAPLSYSGKQMMEYVKLTNGVTLAIRIDFSGANSDSNVVIFDINGKSEPNAIGKDLFAVQINSNGTLGSSPFTPSNNSSNYSETCKGTDGAVSAAACLQILMARDWDLENYLDRG